MRPEDEQPTEDELREAAALAAALEKDRVEAVAGAPAEALETAALLQHARAPIVVPPAQEPIVTALTAGPLDARRARGQRRVSRWIIASLVASSVAAGWLLIQSTAERAAPHAIGAPPPSPALLAAQAEATRGGAGAQAALARLDVEMRAYRRRYHAELRRRGEPR